METHTHSTTHTYTTCPVCKSTDISLQLEAKDYTVSKEDFAIWGCADCQLRFTQNIPVESEIGAYYQSEEYISHSNTSKGIVNSLYQMVRAYTLKQKLSLIKKVSGMKKGNLLDIGCGTGEFLYTMQKADWSVKGLEPDEGARAQAKANHGLDIGEPEELFDLSGKEYDVITMWHVLEHVHRLHEYIAKIQSLLKEGGTLIIAVPNYQSFDAGAYENNWAAYDVPRHLYHFNHTAMRKLVNQHGMDITRMKQMPFDSFYVSLLSEKYRHGKLRLIPGFWKGFRSYLTAATDAKQCSSILYVIKHK